MRIQIQLRIVADDNSVISEGEILHLDKGDDRLEVIGLSFDEAKAALASIQGGVVSAQAASFLARHRSCDLCGSLLLSKGPGRTRFRTAFGTITLSSPRFHCCPCRPGEARTFSPLNLLLTECVAPELLYLETRWASLMSYGMTADLLKDVLPIGSTADASTIRRHLHKVAARHEADLSGEQPGGLEEGPVNGQPLPQAAVIVGIDGGYVRNWHDKKHNFEVGKSMAADRDDRYFGLVRSQDEQPGRRFRDVLRTQALPVTQAVTMLTDGGDSVRALAGELSPGGAGAGCGCCRPEHRLSRAEAAGQGGCRIGHQHRQQRRGDRQLQPTLGQRRADFHRLRGIHRQPRDQSALRQEAADAVVEGRRPPAPADTNQN